MLRQILLLVCGIAGCLTAWRLIVDSAKTIECTQTWKRQPVQVWGPADGNKMRVKWGKDEEQEAIVSVSPLAFYSDYEMREMLENPADAGEKRLDGLLDLWYLPLTWTVALFLVLVSAGFFWKTPLGEDREWRDGAWVKPAGKLPPMAPTVAEVRPPVEYWKAKVLYAFLIGVPLFLGGLYNFRVNLLAGIVATWLGTIVLGWFALTALDHYSEVVWAGELGLEKHSIWGRKRAKWSDVGKVVYEDALENSKRMARESAKRSAGKLPPRLPDLYQWSIQDGEGVEIIALDVESRTAAQLKKMVARAKLEADRRGSAEGSTG